MKAIISSPEQIETIINHHEAKGARPASFRLSCPVKALKKSRLDKSPCPYGEIVKHSHLSTLINFNYEGNVNKQREREGGEADFKVQANWFEHVTPAIVAHRSTGQRYVFVRVLSNLSAPTFTADGVSVAREDVVAYLPADDLDDTERAQAGLPFAPISNPKQELVNEIQPIAIKLVNVRSITVDGVTYSVGEANEVQPERISITREGATVPA